MDEFYHHGIKGQRWGVQNGPPYPLSDHKVFVSGSSKTQFKDSGYYRGHLPKAIKGELDGYMKKKKTILVGDAPGIDRQVQNYLKSKNYDKVEIYGPGTKVRYTANKKWKTHPINDPDHEPMSPEWLAKKDIAMTNDAKEGLAVILDEGAKATRNNVQRLIDQKKNVKIYELNKSGKELDRWMETEEFNRIMNTELSNAKKK